MLRWLCACDVCCGVCCVWCFVWCVAGVWCRCRVSVVSCWEGVVWWAFCGWLLLLCWSGCWGEVFLLLCVVVLLCVVWCVCCVLCVVCSVVCSVWRVCGLWCVVCGVWCVVNYSESRIIVRGAHFSKKKIFRQEGRLVLRERVRLLV